MSHQNLVASELSEMGFETKVTQTGVLVSLKRPVSTLEVKTALDQAFEGIEFKLFQIRPNAIHIITEE